MRFDFAVRYDESVDTNEDIVRRILYNVFVKRIKSNKPCVMFIGGESGEGKSTTALRFEQLLLEIQGLDVKDYIDEINVYTPLQYPQKIDKLLYDKALKKVNIIAVHEARNVVKAKTWQSFLPQAIADVNAMSRSMKPMFFFIISQFIRDITTDIRYTLNFYMTVSRPVGHKARLYIYKMWKDDRDLEKPKLRRSKLRGYLILPNGKRKRYSPEYLEVNMPPRELVKRFEELDMQAKSSIIRHKLDKLMKEMQLEVGMEERKVDTMVKWYTENLDNLKLIGKQVRKKWKLKDEFKDMHDLTRTEVSIFEKKLTEKLKDMGVIDDD